MKIFTGTVPENPYIAVSVYEAYMKGQQSILSQMQEVDFGLLHSQWHQYNDNCAKTHKKKLTFEEYIKEVKP